MIRYLTAGESHGKCLTGILEGLPAGIPVSHDEINEDLVRRQGGYGRGDRMKIERDSIEITAGIRWGKTIGSPIALVVENKDWKNWDKKMSSFSEDKGSAAPVTRPRPGHVDLDGVMKFDHMDARNVLERSSARETAVRVAIGSICKQFLSNFGVKFYSYVLEIGGVAAPPCDGLSSWELHKRAEASELRCADNDTSLKIIEAIKKAKEDGDTLGGIFRVVVEGVPIGLGSNSHHERKLDGILAGALMGIQAMKGVEVGIGFEAARINGSKVHDAIFFKKDTGFYRETNRAGGTEGGITNGQPIVLNVAMKPIATLYNPLPSVDIKSRRPFEASIERSDVCAVPAASVIGEAVTAFVIARAFLEKFGGDSLVETTRNYESYKERLKERYGQV